MGRYPSSDVGLRNPTTGIAGCCARTASGHAAAVALPSVAKNFRRSIWLAMRPPPVGGHSCNGGMIPRFHRVTSSLLARLSEVTQIGRRLVFLRGHEIAVRAHHVVLLADAHVRIGFHANRFDPSR